MAQNGPKWLQKAPPSTVWLYPGLMYLIWGPFTQFWDTKTAKIASELAHFLYFNFKPSGGWGTHLVSLKFNFFCIFGPYRVPQVSKKLPSTYHIFGGKPFFERTTVSYPLLLYLQICPPWLVRTFEDPRLLSNYNYVRGTWPRDTRHTSDIWRTMAGTMEHIMCGPW